MAIVALITGILGEYLAGVLTLVIMLSGGQALEFMLVRKASSVLRALSERMASLPIAKGSGTEDIAWPKLRLWDEIIISPP